MTTRSAALIQRSLIYCSAGPPPTPTCVDPPCVRVLFNTRQLNTFMGDYALCRLDTEVFDLLLGRSSASISLLPALCKQTCVCLARPGVPYRPTGAIGDYLDPRDSSKLAYSTVLNWSRPILKRSRTILKWYRSILKRSRTILKWYRSILKRSRTILKWSRSISKRSRTISEWTHNT